MSNRFNTFNPRPSNSMKDLNDNALAYDDFLNSDKDEAVDRFNRPFPTIRRSVADRINEIIGAQNDAEFYAMQAQIFAGIAESGSDAYATVEEAQSAINDGTEKRQFFTVKEGGEVWVRRYENINGVATPTGDSLPSSEFIDIVISILKTEILDRRSLISRFNNHLFSGLSEIVNDVSGNTPELLTQSGVRHVAALAIGPVRDESPVFKQTSTGASLSGGELNFFNTTVKNISQPTSGLFSGAILIDVDENNNVRRVIYNDGREVVGGVPPGDIEVLIPAEYSRWIPDVKIFQRRDYSYYSDFNFEARRPFDISTADHVVYVDPFATNGGDGSVGSPFNSLGAIEGLTGKVYLRAKAFEYKGNKSFAGVNILASSLVIETWGAGRIVSSTENPDLLTWSKLSNYINIYQASISELGTLVDKSIFLPAISGSGDLQPPSFDRGEHAVYRHVVTMDELDSTPGTCRLNAAKTMVYIHPFRSRVPDSDIITFNNVNNLDYSHPNAVLWMSDVSLFGGTPARVATGQGPSTPMRIYGRRMHYAYSGEGISAGYVTNGASYSYHVQSIVTANIRDGFGYHGIWPLFGYEESCIGRWNGFDAAESNNASTMHDGGMSLRLNCCYPENQNRNIHDINNSQNWLINCVARDATGPINNRYDFLAGAGDTSDNTVTILQDCVGMGSTYNLGTWQGRQTSAKIIVINTRTDGLVFPNSNIIYR